MLEQSDIAHYLLSLGLVKPRAVVETGLTILDTSRRNSVFLATPSGGPTYVVKQADGQQARGIAHEAAVLRALEKTELAPHVPTVVHHEPAAGCLVLRTPSDAQSWSDGHRSGRFPRIPARVLGRLLAALHQLPVDGIEPPPVGVDRMWALSLPEPPHELLFDLSTAAQDLVARIQVSATVCNHLRELGESNSRESVVHGDLRWENCLAVSPPGTGRRTRVLLIDWELAGPGVDAFDVGTVCAEFLQSWVLSIPIFEPDDPGRFVGMAGYPLMRMQPALQTFWSAYSRANPRHPPLTRVIELAGVRLIQSAVEHAQGLGAPSAHLVTLLQLADNLLGQPDDAAMNLLRVGP